MTQNSIHKHTGTLRGYSHVWHLRISNKEGPCMQQQFSIRKSEGPHMQAEDSPAALRVAATCGSVPVPAARQP